MGDESAAGEAVLGTRLPSVSMKLRIRLDF
jgi:hypothetical protein